MRRFLAVYLALLETDLVPSSTSLVLSGIIHNFGQTPRKIFDSPHPRRAMFGKPGLPVGVRYGVSENFGVLIQSRGELRLADLSRFRATELTRRTSSNPLSPRQR